MRLETLRLRNFRGYEDREFKLHPEFNLVVGENGAGKTSFLEAAAVAIGAWLLGIGGHDSRNIREHDVRVVRELIEKRYRELPQYPVRIDATGTIHAARVVRNTETGALEYGVRRAPSPEKTYPWDTAVRWGRSLDGQGGRTTRARAKSLTDLSQQMVRSVFKQDALVLPLIRYFSAGRLWELVRDTDKRALSKHKGKQPAELAADADELDKALFDFEKLSEPFYGYRMSVDGRCNQRDMIRWMAFERRNELDEDEESPALRLVYRAIESLLPEIESASYNVKLGTLLLHHGDGQRLTFSELSDGYRNVVTIAADLAIKAAMLNPQLAERALELTPGVVLIDELDLHLHPKWQRRIIKDLRRTFPMIQFICTTHSPQLIGQAKADEIIVLDVQTPDQQGAVMVATTADAQHTDHPAQSFGMDSNWVLRHIMGSEDRDPGVASKLDAIFEHIEEARFDLAQQAVDDLRSSIGEHPELVEAQALISRYTRFGEAAAE
ncbi:MAG: AAA family ATPase [Burkholderiaceae bacterium]|nr:AAA family ATPase [Burkholderiaceae bacterium]